MRLCLTNWGYCHLMDEYFPYKQYINPNIPSLTVIDWCRENFGPSVILETDLDKSGFFADFDNLWGKVNDFKYYFKNEDDTLFFRMRWGDFDDQLVPKCNV